MSSTDENLNLQGFWLQAGTDSIQNQNIHQQSRLLHRLLVQVKWHVQIDESPGSPGQASVRLPRRTKEEKERKDFKDDDT